METATQQPKLTENQRSTVRRLFERTVARCSERPETSTCIFLTWHAVDSLLEQGYPVDRLPTRLLLAHSGLSEREFDYVLRMFDWTCELERKATLIPVHTVALSPSC